MGLGSRFRHLVKDWDRLSLCVVRYLGDDPRELNFNLGKGIPERWRLRIFIVARQNYFESVKDYPVSDLRELRRVLRFEVPPEPLKGPVKQRIERLGEHSFRVTRWILDGTAVPPLSGIPTLLIPETALLPRDGKVHRFPHSKGVLLHLVGPEGQRSALMSKVEDQDHLLEAMGAESATLSPMTPASKKDPMLMKALEAGLHRLPMRSLVGFWHFESIARKPFPWTRTGILSGLMVASYLLLTSLGLLLHNAYLNFRLEQLADEIDASLIIQRQLNAAELRLKERASLLGSGAPGWTMWPVIVDLTQQGMKPNALRFENGEATVFGSAPRATDLLEFTISHPLSEEARFIQPVRPGPDGERFAMRFQPRPLPPESGPDA